MHLPTRSALAASTAIACLAGVVPVASAGAASGAVGPSRATSAAFRSCAPVKDVGRVHAGGADAVSIRAKVTSCTTARVVARDWSAASVKQGGETVTVGRYRCTQSSVGDRIQVRCTARAGRVVRFRLG